MGPVHPQENFNHFQRKIWMVKPKAAEFDSLLDTCKATQPERMQRTGYFTDCRCGLATATA